MCAPIATILPWLTGAAAVATVATAMRPAPSISMPEAPKVETPAPAPTVQEVNPNKTNTSALARDQMRRQAAAAQSWLSTKNTGGLGIQGAATTKKTVLGGISTPLGAGV